MKNKIFDELFVKPDLMFVCTNEINNVLKQETPFMIFDINNLNETLQKKNNYATYVVILD